MTAPLAISALNLPEHLHDYLEMCLRVITTTEGALRDRNEQRALGVVEALQHTQAVNRAEGDVLRGIIEGTAQQARIAQQGEPGLILPSCQVEGADLVIRFNIDSLCHSVTMGDSWPVQGDGQSAATIVDRAQFLVELGAELLREDEVGATPLHRLFDEAALEVIEQGGESIELHEDEDEE